MEDLKVIINVHFTMEEYQWKKHQQNVFLDLDKN
jgi:hypothetical protein